MFFLSQLTSTLMSECRSQLDELDLDIALDHLNGISSFLQILGVRTEGLSLTPLIDKLMAIKHEGEAVDEIMDFFYKNGVPIDESRKRNLVRTESPRCTSFIFYVLTKWLPKFQFTSLKMKLIEELVTNIELFHVYVTFIGPRYTSFLISARYQ